MCRTPSVKVVGREHTKLNKLDAKAMRDNAILNFIYQITPTRTSLPSPMDELGLRPAMTDYFAGRRQGYAYPRAVGIFSNLAWRLLLLNLWSVRYLSA